MLASRLDQAQEAHLYLSLTRSSQTLAQLGRSLDCSIQELQAHLLFSRDQSPQEALIQAFQALCSIMHPIVQGVKFSFLCFQTELDLLADFIPEVKAVPLMISILVIQLSFLLSMHLA